MLPVNRAALRFLYLRAIGQNWFEEGIPSQSAVRICRRCSAPKRSRACWISRRPEALAIRELATRAYTFVADDRFWESMQVQIS